MIIKEHIKTSLNIVKEQYFSPNGELKYIRNYSEDSVKDLEAFHQDIYFIDRAYAFLNASAYTPLETKQKQQTLQDLSSAKAMSALVIKTIVREIPGT